MKNSSLRQRLFGSMALLLLVALIPPFYYYDKMLRSDILQETTERAIKSLDTVSMVLREERHFVDMNELDALLTRLGASMGVRITYIVDGRVVADSSVPYDDVSKLDPHDSRPEVRAANHGRTDVEVRYSTTLGKELFYAAQPAVNIPGIADGVLRVAIPVSLATERLDKLESGMLWVLLATILATGLIGFFSTRPLLRSIEALSTAAQRIGQGHYKRRIRVYPGKEFKPLADAINGMAHNIEQHLSQLMEQKGQLEAVFDGMNEGVMVLDATGRVHSFNKALSAMFPGLKSRQGATPMEATMRPELQHMVTDLLDHGIEACLRVQIPLPGTGRHAEVNLVPFTDPSKVRRVVMVFHDISERERVERMRRDFVANVSHELKTPLTSIKGYTETLLESPATTPEQSAHFLGIILKNANHMIKMVNSLLVLARTQHKGEATDLVPVEMTPLLRQALRDVAPVAEAKGIILEEAVSAPIPPIMGDKDGLSEVFRNLLDNAIKYSPTGSTVTLAAHIEGNQAVFAVRDQGPGIPDEAKDRIFERFYRIEHPGEPAVKNGSAGLGLAICRRIIKSHRGEIRVESPLDPATHTGAAFLVFLRLASSHE